MKHKGFTFIELLLVILCIAVLVTGAGFSFKRAKTSHMADTFAQEVVILKTAIETYYESRGTLPQPDSANEGLAKLSSYEKLKNFWKPFNPDASNVLANTCWYGNISEDLNTVYLQLYRYEIQDGKRTNVTTPVVFSDAEIVALQKKMESVCKFDKLPSGEYVCYIFQDFISSAADQPPTTPPE